MLVVTCLVFAVFIDFRVLLFATLFSVLVLIFELVFFVLFVNINSISLLYLRLFLF